MRQFPHVPRPALLIGLALIFFAILAFVVPASSLLAVMDNLFIGVVGAVTIVYAPMIRRAVADHDFDRISQLTLGIFFTWISLAGTKLANSVLHAPLDTTKLINVYLVSVLAYMAVLGGILHISAPGMSGTEWKYHCKTLVFGIIAGTLVSVISGYIRWG